MGKKEDRGSAERSEKKVHVNSLYPKPTHDKLKLFAASCGITKTEMQAYFTELCLSDENILRYVADQFKDKACFRLIPSKVDGELKFIISDKKPNTP